MADRPRESIHAGHRLRLRERFFHEGLLHFSEHEVLELLLTYAIPQKDVNLLAHALIDQFGSLCNVLDADRNELMRVPGIGENAASLLSMIPQLLGYYQIDKMGERPTITDLKSARQYCDALFLGVNEERLYLLCMDQRGRVLYPAMLQRGTPDEVAVHTRSVVETAILHDAYATLLVHNHPSGECEPSLADLEATRLAASALLVIAVRLVDHLIVAGNRVYSMAQHSRGDAPPSDDFSYVMRGGRETAQEFFYLTPEHIEQMMRKRRRAGHA